MKKTVLTLLFFAAISSASFAQVSFGPKLGLGITSQKDTKVSSGSANSYTAILTPQVGVVLNAQLGDHFAIRPELLYVQRGAKNASSGTTITYRAGYIELPINIAVGLQAGPGKLEVFAGPSFGFSLGGHYKVESSGYSGSGSLKAKKQPESTSGSTDMYMNPFNASLNFGLDYKFDNGLLIQVGYNLGLTNIHPHYANSTLESNRKDDVTKSSSINFGVAYLFGGK